jgi:hypothetical protein
MAGTIDGPFTTDRGTKVKAFRTPEEAQRFLEELSRQRDELSTKN